MKRTLIALALVAAAGTAVSSQWSRRSRDAASDSSASSSRQLDGFGSRA